MFKNEKKNSKNYRYIVLNLHAIACSFPRCSGSVMDCHATARGSILDWNGVFTELHVLVNGGAVSK